jgi:hypothetical protein
VTRLHGVNAAAFAGGVLLCASAVLFARQQPSTPLTGANYLYIQEYEIPTGIAPNDAIAEASQWVRDMRKIEEYKSVRLFIHNTGPAFAIYILAEPRDWQAIETAANKVLCGAPGYHGEATQVGRPQRQSPQRDSGAVGLLRCLAPAG